MPADPEGLVLLTATRYEFEAATIAEALRARGIPAEVFGVAARVMQWELGINTQIQVMVRRADLEAARGELGAIREDAVADADAGYADMAATDSDTGASEEPQISAADSRNRCSSCGYDRTRVDPNEPCPSCGTVQPSAAVPTSHRAALIIVLLLLALAVIARLVFGAEPKVASPIHIHPGNML